VRLAGVGSLRAGWAVAGATRRTWLPIVAAAAPCARPARRFLLGAVVVPPVREWRQRRPAVGLGPWLVLRTADEFASCLGLWQGLRATRSLRALAPRFPPLEQLLPPDTP
jgi:hypothetical protein